MLSDLLTMTVAQAIAWILAVGIAGLVAYGVGWLPVSDFWKSTISYVVVAMLTAGVTAISGLLPTEFLQMKLIDAALVLLTMLIGAIGSVRFFAAKARAHVAKVKATGVL